jgi:hypothetical protein
VVDFACCIYPSHFYFHSSAARSFVIAFIEENHSKVIDLEIIPSVLQLVSSPDADIQKDASNALAYLSRNGLFSKIYDIKWIFDILLNKKKKEKKGNSNLR